MSALAAAGAAYGRLTLLADPTDVGDEKHKAGPIAILVIVILCVACFVLFRSMSKHLRRVRDDFPTDDDPQGPAGVASDAPTTTGSAAAPGTATVVARETSTVDETPSDTRSG